MMKKKLYCIYVAIGQKDRQLPKFSNITRHGAMDYTIIVSATASDPAPLQFLAPILAVLLGNFSEIMECMH